MNELTIRDVQLPETIEQKAEYVLFGTDALADYRAKLSAIKKRFGIIPEQYKQLEREAQETAENVLLFSVDVGEHIASLPKDTSFHGNQHKEVTSPMGVNTKKGTIEEMGFTRKQAEDLQTIAAHPDIVQNVIEEARQNGDVASRSAVLKKIQKAKAFQEQREAIEQATSTPRSSAYVDIFTTDNKYRVIYADPPWSYMDRQGSNKLGGASKHYNTMPIDEICALPIPAADTAVLFLWVTSPLLEDSFKVINAWGFKYKTSFVWDKVAHNMGHYNSVRHEFLLIATRGSCTPDVKKLYDSVVSIERTEHSKKPKEFRDMIDTLYPIGSRIELFAREAADGWDVWGDMA